MKKRPKIIEISKRGNKCKKPMTKEEENFKWDLTPLYSLNLSDPIRSVFILTEKCFVSSIFLLE